MAADRRGQALQDAALEVKAKAHLRLGLESGDTALHVPGGQDEGPGFIQERALGLVVTVQRPGEDAQWQVLAIQALGDRGGSVDLRLVMPRRDLPEAAGFAGGDPAWHRAVLPGALFGQGTVEAPDVQEVAGADEVVGRGRHGFALAVQGVQQLEVPAAGRIGQRLRALGAPGPDDRRWHHVLPAHCPTVVSQGRRLGLEGDHEAVVPARARHDVGGEAGRRLHAEQAALRAAGRPGLAGVVVRGPLTVGWRQGHDAAHVQFAAPAERPDRHRLGQRPAARRQFVAFADGLAQSLIAAGEHPGLAVPPDVRDLVIGLGRTHLAAVVPPQVQVHAFAQDREGAAPRHQVAMAGGDGEPGLGAHDGLVGEAAAGAQEPEHDSGCQRRQVAPRGVSAG